MMPTDAQTAGAACDPKAVADLLRAMAHPMRLTILCRLVEGELSVGGFEAELGLKQPSLSQQLGLLREAGLVTTRREAKSVVYAIADPRLGSVLDALRRFVSAAEVLPAPSAAHPPPTLPAPARPIPAALNECGMFSVAGWPAARLRSP